MIARAAAVFALAALALLAAPSFSFAAGTPAAKNTPNPRAWSTAYETTDVNAKDLLAHMKSARGSLGEGTHTMRIDSTFRDGGLEGTEHDTWSGDDYRIDSTVGPFVSAEGRVNGQRWETNENGYTLLKRGLHQRSEANARALDQPDPGNDVKVLGKLHDPADVYVLRVAPADGRPELRFYDAASFRMVRRETAYLDRLVVTTYSDFHASHGVTMAYMTTLSDGHPENDEVWNIVDLKIDVPVLPAELEVPGSRRLPVAFPEGVDRVKLPARIDPWGTVIVRLTVNGRGLDFELDSGAAGIVLNRDVARELGLKIHGRWSNTVAGTFTSGRAIVPKVEIGSVVMTDLVVDALPFAYKNDWSTRVVGLLGFDFIAGCVVKIDYEHGVVEAIRSEAFVPPSNGIALDAILDDQVPMVWMKVNGTLGEHFILDTGSNDVVFFSAFAKKHPDAVDDHSPEKILSRIFPVVQAEGVGGRLNIRPVLVAGMQLGNVSFKDYLAFVMAGDQPAFEGEESDGLIGASTLRSFDVYLDYAGSRVVLVPNGTTKKIVPKQPGG
jgi:hypothetical protein